MWRLALFLGFIALTSAAPLNIHVIPHTHDDVGWLKTADQYYTGANNSIYTAGVRWILDTVVPALEKNPERKFIYVEQFYFATWWGQQDTAMQARVKALVASGQLEFILGGWVMPDEANPHYVDLVDALTLGALFLKETFDVAPKTVWQIDPFGHSSTYASLTAQMGFDSFVLGRIDYQDRAHRKATGTMEFLWSPSPSLGAAADIFGITLFENYNPPGGYGSGFCFDLIMCDDQPVQADPNLENMNVQVLADRFVALAKEQRKSYTSDNVLFTMGSDFQYQSSPSWFTSLDALLGYIQDNAERYGVNAFYSTPSIYTDFVHAAGLNYTVTTDDFFPYADQPAAYWTGYFTSRPALKGYIRRQANLLATCRQLEVATAAVGPESSSRLWDAMGVAQHHDAITGTERQPVAYDYAKRLAIGGAECDALGGAAVARLASRVYDGQAYRVCNHLNVSICEVTQAGGDVVTLLYNPLAAPRAEWVRLPVQHTGYQVRNGSGVVVPSQVVPNPPPIVGRDAAAPYTLVFEAQLPPLGFATFFVVENASRADPAEWEPIPASQEVVEVSNGRVTLSFDAASGLLAGVTDHTTNTSVAGTQYLGFYNASAGDHQPHPPLLNPGQASGAYIFRPNSSDVFGMSPGGGAKISVSRGPWGTEVLQEFGAWAYQIVRLYHGDNHAEFEYTVGPIDVSDGDGKEVISRFETNLATNAVWWTDSNGREMLQRKRNYRQTWDLNCTQAVACNYVPVSTAAFIRDADNDAQFLVMSDRSNAGTSMLDGSVELMLHRRLLYDDGRGVGEPLDEPGITGKGLVVRARHWISLSDVSTGGERHRSLIERLTFAPTFFFAPSADSPSAWAADHHVEWSGLTSASLPPNVFLQTLQWLSPKTLIVRFAHMYARGESSKYSVPVSFDATALFSTFDVISWEEKVLSANQPVEALNNRMHWNVDSQKTLKKGVHGTAAQGDSWVVQLEPMQIRTWLVQIAPVTRSP